MAAGPVSRILSVPASRDWTAIPLGRASLRGSSDLPEGLTHRAGTCSRPKPRTSSLFGLAPCGVCPARGITVAAVRSYRTFSPLPWRRCPGFVILSEAKDLRVPENDARESSAFLADEIIARLARILHKARTTTSGRYIFCGTFRRADLNPPSRTLSGTLLCGVRTFLSPRPKARRATARSGCLRNDYRRRTQSRRQTSDLGLWTTDLDPSQRAQTMRGRRIRCRLSSDSGPRSEVRGPTPVV